MLINVDELELKTKYKIEMDSESEYIFGVEGAGPIFVKEIGKSNIEKFAVLCLDHTNKIINFAIISMGDAKRVPVMILQLFRVIMISNATKFIIGHNHPSGILDITKLDIQMTKKIGTLGNLLGLELIDSIIVNKDEESISIRERYMELENEWENI